ncbi:MAG: helix-turn-helix domain-containing protein [Parvibaculales bacterium]
MKRYQTFCKKRRAGFLRLENPDVEAIRHLACAQLVVGNIGLAYRVPVLAIMGAKKGRQKVSEARQISQYLCHIIFSQTLSNIGIIFKRDRTSVSHACQRVEFLRDEAAHDLAIDYLELGVKSLAGSLGLTQSEDS